MSSSGSIFQTLRTRGPRALPAAHWRGLGGLTILVLAVAQSAFSLRVPTQLVVAGLLTLAIVVAWLAQIGRPHVWPIGVMGAASSALMLVSPGTGAVIGVISAIVNAGLRLPVRSGAVASLAIGLAFLFADGVTSQWSAPVNLGLRQWV